jgi:glycosyltransferase involved in cell wall biosynthesis
MKQTPILFISDNPTLHTGLARIGRDLASLTCTIPDFRVGYLGRGIGVSRRLPFIQYDYPESGQWGESYIQSAWEDISNGDAGIIFTLDDLSRRHWFVRPEGLGDSLATFLGSSRTFRRWAYTPLDATGPNGITLPIAQTDCLNRFDRVLTASEWGFRLALASGRADADWLPHGYDGGTFKLQPRSLCAAAADWDEKLVVVGCNMANQARKDFPAAFDAFTVLRNHYGNRFKAWLNTDELIRHWNMYALAADYGLGDCLEATTGLSDQQLALRYGACACTILPSAGEGFGYPIVESSACGTPCIVTDYAAGQELVAEDCRVEPITYRVDTQHNVRRAVLAGRQFANKAIPQIEKKLADWDHTTECMWESTKHLDWTNLKHLWVRWLVGGLK